MKVSTVSIAMAILCTLSSWRNAEGGDSIALAVGSSTAVAVNKGSSDGTDETPLIPVIPFIPELSIPGSLCGSNVPGSNKLDLNISSLINSIKVALTKTGLCVEMMPDLNLALKSLLKVSEQACDVSVIHKKVAYYEAREALTNCMSV